MAGKKEKAWEWDLEKEQKTFKDFCTDFVKKDPIFAQWADCYHTICMKGYKSALYNKAHQRPVSQRPENFKPSEKIKEYKNNIHEPEATNDPVIHTIGKMLAESPERETERLYYLTYIISNSENLDREEVGHDLCYILGVALEYRKKIINQPKPKI